VPSEEWGVFNWEGFIKGLSSAGKNEDYEADPEKELRSLRARKGRGEAQESKKKTQIRRIHKRRQRLRCQQRDCDNRGWTSR